MAKVSNIVAFYCARKRKNSENTWFEVTRVFGDSVTDGNMPFIGETKEDLVRELRKAADDIEKNEAL